MKIVSHIDDPVTTTDELIPSGETSSFRSNPLRLAEFTLSRRDPAYVSEAKAVKKLEEERTEGTINEAVVSVYETLKDAGIAVNPDATNIASAIYAKKPGDGSAREQAASCQRVLGAAANFAEEYATKRYRSNCINWGILPFVTQAGDQLPKNSWVFAKNIREALLEGTEIEAYAVNGKDVAKINVSLGALTDEEKRILADGCLINYYRN